MCAGGRVHGEAGRVFRDDAATRQRHPRQDGGDQQVLLHLQTQGQREGTLLHLALNFDTFRAQCTAMEDSFFIKLAQVKL